MKALATWRTLPQNRPYILLSQLTTLDSEDLHSSNDEFHDAVEAVDEDERIGVDADPVFTEERGEGAKNDFNVEKNEVAVKQEPNALKCELTTDIGEEMELWKYKIETIHAQSGTSRLEHTTGTTYESLNSCLIGFPCAEEKAFHVLVETRNNGEESPAVSSASSVHNYSLPPEFDTTTVTNTVATIS